MNSLATTSHSGLTLLKKLFTFTKPYRGRFWWSVILSIILAMLSPVRPYLIQLAVDDYITNKLLSQLYWLCAIQFGVLILESALRFIFMYVSNWVGQNIVDDIRKAIFKKIVYQNLSYFDNTPVGTLTTRTVNDIEAVNDIFSEGIISIFADILTIIAIMSIMFYTDWRLTLVSLAAFPFLIVATYFFKEAVKKSFQNVRNAVSSLNAFVQEHITGMYIVQAFGIEDKEERKFERINRSHRDANIKSIFAYSVFFPVVEIILAVATGLLVWYGATQMLDYDVTQGVIIAFIMYLNMLFRPLRVLADKFNTMQMGLVAGERVINVLESDEYLKNNGSKVPQSLKGDIELVDVHFEYKTDIPVLRGVSFDVKAGQTVAIVGHTGAGKSSIISILTRLYEIKSGLITIDHIPLQEYDILALRKQVAVVLQDVFLFSGTIFENITMKDDRLNKDQVISVCKDLDIHDFIMKLPGGYDFNVQERGGTLSQGQRQLISFARALIFDPSILILDEATASVDSNSEQMVQHAIDKLIQGRTSIVIAHRLSTIRKSDKIIVLEKGKVIEQGTHQELIANDGYYNQMYLATLDQEHMI